MNTVKQQFICEQCGNSFQTKQHNKKYIPKFCSILCRNRALIIKNSQNKIILGKKCPICGRYGRDRIEDICIKCSGKKSNGSHLWTAQEIEYLHAHYSQDGCQLVASVLKLNAKAVRSKANKLHLKISKETTRRLIYNVSQARMTSNNPMYSQISVHKMLKTWEDNPEKMKQRNQNFLDGKLEYQKTKPSKLEIRLRNILDDLGAEYEASALIKPKFIVDIRIGNLIIQADGEYWHGHPRFEPFTERQIAQQKRDQAQDNYLRACGYTVIRIWDRDITPGNIHSVLKAHNCKFPLRI